jgi:hypothetical protein
MVGGADAEPLPPPLPTSVTESRRIDVVWLMASILHEICGTRSNDFIMLPEHFCRNQESIWDILIRIPTFSFTNGNESMTN